jgi:hypothetical protein
MQQETRLQKNVIQWWDLAARGYGLDPRLLSHCPNGGKRGKIEAAIFKAIGVRAGFEDLFLAVPAHGKHGLFLEMKAPDGRISTEQRQMMALHALHGYAVTVAWSFDEAVGAITRYLKTGDPLKLP